MDSKTEIEANHTSAPFPALPTPPDRAKSSSQTTLHHPSPPPSQSQPGPVSDDSVLPSFHQPPPASTPGIHHTQTSQTTHTNVSEKAEDFETKEGNYTGRDAEEGDEEGGRKRMSFGGYMKKYRAVVHVGLILLLLGWWIPGIVMEDTRHYFVVTSIITWFFIGLIFFQHVPTSYFSRPISKTWSTLVSGPWLRLTHRLRLGIGWVCLLALVFGSAFGVQLSEGATYGDRAVSVFGLFVFQSGFWLTSHNRKAIKWQTVIIGLGLQQILALFVLKTGAGFNLFNWIATAATDLLEQGSNAGAFFWSPEIVQMHTFFVATLSAIIFFLAFVQLLYYFGILQWLVTKFSWFFFKLLAISGAEAVVASASPFIGQGESAALVKPYIKLMTPAEIHQVMASGFATISGSVLIAYINLGIPAVNLITASVMSIPAAIAISKLRYPETGEPLTAGRVTLARDENRPVNALLAYSKGAMFGLLVAGCILANVLTVLALLYTVDGLLTWIGQFWGLAKDGPNPLTLELILQYVFYPVAWLMGTPGPDIMKVSRLLGVKLIANEFVAYSRLAPEAASFTPRGYTIATYALCSFSNFGSLGINIGILSSMAPTRQDVISRLAFSALICGFFSCCQTAGIAGMLV